MPAINSTRITIGTTTFSYNSLVVRPNKYLPLMKPLFKENTFKQKETETYDKYLKRLFGLLCNRSGMLVSTNGRPAKRRGPRARNEQLSTEAVRIMNSMGIEVTKTNPCSLNVIFKHTGKKYRMKRDALNALIDSVKKNTTFKHHSVNHVKIGVELEFIGKDSKLDNFTEKMKQLVGANRYNPIMRYHKNNGIKWELGRDCSVHGKRSEGTSGYELTSPIFSLRSKKDMRELCNVCKLIKDEFGGTTNNSCGTHIHMSFDVPNTTDELCRHFARWYLKSEDTMFDKVVPLRRRENRARYSHSVSENRIWDRYRKVNFCNVQRNTKRMHLEFRQLDGTLDYDKIMAWCKLQKLFVDLTMENWNSTEDKGESAQAIELADVIVSEELDDCTIESLMNMSSMITAIA